jgi:WD40 repeat protein
MFLRLIGKGGAALGVLCLCLIALAGGIGRMWGGDALVLTDSVASDRLVLIDLNSGVRWSRAIPSAMVTSLSWAADGRVLWATNNEQLFVESADYRTITQRRDWYGHSAAWSPDGAWIASAANIEGDSEIYLYNIGDGYRFGDRRAITQLTFNTTPNGVPAWSPDGRWLLYTKRTEMGDLVMAYSMDDGATYTSVGSSSEIGGLAWNGQTLAYTDYSNARAKIILATVDHTFRAVDFRLLNGSVLPQTLPAWSPDGARLAYVESTPSSGQFAGMRTLLIVQDGVESNATRRLWWTAESISAIAWWQR